MLRFIGNVCRLLNIYSGLICAFLVLRAKSGCCYCIESSYLFWSASAVVA